MIFPFYYNTVPLTLPCEMMITQFGLICEEWKPIQIIYPECIFPYYISNFGKIYNGRENKIIIGSISTGYSLISICINTYVYIRELAHRLVAKLFIPNPNNHPIINHKDGNKLNNFFLNLEWCTQKHNVNHAIDMGLKYINKGEEVYNSIYTEEQIHEICKSIENGKDNKYICEKILKVEYSRKNCNIIYDLKNKNAWSHIANQYNLNKKKHLGQVITDIELNNLYEYILKGFTNVEIVDDILKLPIDKRKYYMGVLFRLRNGTHYKQITNGINLNIERVD